MVMRKEFSIREYVNSALEEVSWTDICGKRLLGPEKISVPALQIGS